MRQQRQAFRLYLPPMVLGQADHADAVIASSDELLSSESMSGQKGETR